MSKFPDDTIEGGSWRPHILRIMDTDTGPEGPQTVSHRTTILRRLLRRRKRRTKPTANPNTPIIGAGDRTRSFVHHPTGYYSQSARWVIFVIFALLALPIITIGLFYLVLSAVFVPAAVFRMIFGESVGLGLELVYLVGLIIWLVDFIRGLGSPEKKKRQLIARADKLIEKRMRDAGATNNDT